MCRFGRNRERLLTITKALRLLQETADGSGWLINDLHQIEVMKDWPGRRLTVRLTARGHRADPTMPADETIVFYGKLFRSRRGQAIFTRHRAAFDRLEYLAKSDDPAPSFFRLRLPEPVGYHPDRRFLLMTELPGENLGDALRESRSPGGNAPLLERAGRMVATLHQLSSIHQQTDKPRQDVTPADTGPLSSLIPTHAAKEEIEILDCAGSRIGEAVLPEKLLRRYFHLREAVLDTLRMDSSERRALLHRDLYPHQVILSPDGDGLVDLDELALGPPELDAGNFVAHLLLDDLRHPAPNWSWEEGTRSFLSGYAGQASLHPEMLAVYTCGALLRLASLRRLAGTAGGSASDRALSGWIDLITGIIGWVERIIAEPRLLSAGHTAGADKGLQ